MDKIKIKYMPVLIIGILIFLIGACQDQQSSKSQIEQQPHMEESTPTIMVERSQTDTPQPTPSDTPVPSETPLPTQTPIPSPEVIAGPELPQFLLIPSGYLQVDDWFGIPVFPGIIKSQEAYDGYYYSADKPVSVVRSFYEEELDKAGWILTAIGEGEGGHLLLIFSKGGDKASITLYNFASAANDPNSSIQIPPSNVLIVVE